MSRSPSAPSRSKRLLTAASLAILAALPVATNAFALTPQTKTLDGALLQKSANDHQWLMADKGGKDDKDDDDDRRGRNRHRDRRGDRDDENNRENDREVRIDLNRAKNLARQAAEAANGGIRYYRAEDSMHGPAQRRPYVDNGDSWTFTFSGTRVGSMTRTIESVVTVYKYSSRILVAYNGSVRTLQQPTVQQATVQQSMVQQTQFVSFSSSQRTVLVDMLRGDCSCSNLLSSATRTEIVSQSRSLPPGIQKQLLRGRGLPPGIAKKFVRLPKQVNTYINLPTYYDLLVVGSNVVVVNQVNYVVVDYISNVFR